jgi:hypothetical protein
VQLFASSALAVSLAFNQGRISNPLNSNRMSISRLTDSGLGFDPGEDIGDCIQPSPALSFRVMA